MEEKWGEEKIREGGSRERKGSCASTEVYKDQQSAHPTIMTFNNIGKMFYDFHCKSHFSLFCCAFVYFRDD